MAGSTTGAYAVAAMLKTLLQAKLATELAAQITAAGVSWSLSAPSSTNGYSDDPTHLPRDRADSIQIYVVRATEVSKVVNISGPIDQEVVCEVRWHMHARLADLGPKKQVAARSVSKVIRQYWRAYNDDAVCVNLSANADFVADNLRLSDGVPGRRGEQAASGDNIDTVIVRVRALQRVDAPVSFSA